MKIRAIIFGATGMVGEGVLHQAIQSEDVESILVIGRRACGVKDTKLKEIIHDDFYDYSAVENKLSGYNACYFCLGVSSVGMKEKDYRRITYDLTIKAAEVLARLNPGMTFCYVSGAGTDSAEKGRIMWARVKGRTENELMKFGFKGVYLFRPGFIKPIKGLKKAYKISKAVGVIYPVLEFSIPKYVCKLEDLGNAMIQAVIGGYYKPFIENVDIKLLAEGKKLGN